MEESVTEVSIRDYLEFLCCTVGITLSAFTRVLAKKKRCQDPPQLVRCRYDSFKHFMVHCKESSEDNRSWTSDPAYNERGGVQELK